MDKNTFIILWFVIMLMRILIKKCDSPTVLQEPKTGQEPTMTRRLNNGTMELLDKAGNVVGTRPATDREVREWTDGATAPATDEDIRQWGRFIWDHMEEWG